MLEIGSTLWNLKLRRQGGATSNNGGGRADKVRKSKGCSQKTSGRSYSLKHPVARHFVWPLLVQVVCRPQTVQNKWRGVSPHGRNCAARGKIYFSGRGMEKQEKLATDFNGSSLIDGKFSCDLPFSVNESSDIIHSEFLLSTNQIWRP